MDGRGEREWEGGRQREGEGNYGWTRGLTKMQGGKPKKLMSGMLLAPVRAVSVCAHLCPSPCLSLCPSLPVVVASSRSAPLPARVR